MLPVLFAVLVESPSRTSGDTRPVVLISATALSVEPFRRWPSVGIGVRLSFSFVEVKVISLTAC